MGRLRASGLLLASLCCLGAVNALVLPNGQAVQHSVFKGVARWRLIPYLWVDKSVNVTCEFTKEFKVYTAPSVEALAEKVDRKESVWCGWHNFLGQHSCVARVSPFAPVHVAVVHEYSSGNLCTLALAERLSPFMICQTVAGALLFLFASPLSASMFFRLGTGSAGVMLLSVIILLFLVSRTLPSKKSAAALFAIFGSSFTGLVRYVFGQWIPSFEQLIYNKVVLAYMAASGMLGLAVTYYYDREDNVKLHNILKYGLKLVGLVLMALSTSMPEASVTLCCLLLASQLLQPVMFLWRQGEVSARTLSDLVSESPAMFRKHKPRTAAAASRFKPAAVSKSAVAPPVESDEDEGIDPSAAVSASQLVEEEDEELSRSTGDSSERAFVQAAKTPFPDEDARASDHRRRATSAVPIGAADNDSPWLKKGLALNLETGRTVKMGGSTWNKLVLQGYQVDRQQGTLTPPAKGRTSTVFTPTPASRVKARRSPNT